MQPVRIHPSLTLSDVYGTDRLYAPRASSRACTWLPDDPSVLDVLTGGQLAIMGDMPILCAAGVSTPEGLSLMRDVGLAVPSAVYQYRDEAECSHRIKEWHEGGADAVIVHVRQAGELPPESFWIRPESLSFVNNKANLSLLVDEESIPRRRIVPVKRLSSEVAPGDLPVVIKAVTDESTGGGCDVLICDRPNALERAPEYFAACEMVVVEEWMAIVRNLCLSYAVLADGDVRYLGSAEQVSAPDGSYRGNWLDAASAAPPEAVEAGAHACREGFARGYWGIVGIDVAVLEDGRVSVFDLNFRTNGSTAAVCLAPGLRDQDGWAVLRFVGLKTDGDFDKMLRAVDAAVDKGLLLPTCLYDPAANGRPLSPPLMNGLVPGESREEVCERLLLLAESGLT